MERSGPRRLFVTRILKQFDCDTFIPDFNMDKYKLLPEWVPNINQRFLEKKKTYHS